MIGRRRRRPGFVDPGDPGTRDAVTRDAEPAAPPVDIRAVARAADVSVGTVSNVVNHPDRVALGTIHRVNLAIEQLHWTPNAAARSLAHTRRAAD